MTQRLTISCPVCASSDHRVKYTPSKHIDDPKQLYGAASGVPGTQTLVKCRTCGLLYENPRFSEDDIIKGYSAAVEADHDSQYGLREESFYRALLSLEKQIPGKGAGVLDVGAAGGAFLKAAERFGYLAQGIEPSAYLVESGKKRGLNMVQGTLDHHSFQKGQFDMVCFWDVLEHVVDPIKTLRQAVELIKPGGTLLVNYPDIGTPMAKLAGGKFWWILSVHLVHFDRSTLSKSLRSVGYEPFYWKPYWQSLELGYMMRLFEIYFPGPGALLKKLFPSFLSSIRISYYASQTTCLSRKKNP